MKEFTRITTLVALAALVFVGACSDDDDPVAPGNQSNAYVRVLHASPDAPNVDVLVDGAVVLTDVPYQSFSSYLKVPAGAHNFKVRAAGTTTVVIDVTPTLSKDNYYTVIARDPLASIEPWLLTDDHAAPASGNVKVRLVHAAPGAPVVDIYVTAPGADLATSTPVLTDIPYEAASGFLEVPAGNYQNRITPANTTTVAIDSGPLALTAGQVRTGVAVDAPGGGAPFGAVLLPDRN